MNKASNIEGFYNQQRVIKHLHRADWLFIILPMVLAVVLFIIFPILLLVSEKLRGNRTDLQGFEMGGLLIIAGVFLCSLFCGGYGFLAFILSLLTRRNLTFRILLVVVPILTVFVFYIYLVWKDPANFS